MMKYNTIILREAAEEKGKIRMLRKHSARTIVSPAASGAGMNIFNKKQPEHLMNMSIACTCTQ